MEKVIFGYCIGPDVQLDLANRRLVNWSGDKNGGKLNKIILRDTMLRLFTFLLENANGSVIPNEKILINVWDKYRLRSSNQRLWQVMKELKFRLDSIGVPDDFIMRIESKGYYLKESMITTLYCVKHHDETLAEQTS
ncbi:TPA: transcriptional regulator [Serratia fonticola]